MLFNSYVFMLAFLPLTLLGYFLLGRLPEKIQLNKVFLVLASFLFYGYNNPSYVPIIAGSILINYALSQLMLAQRKKALRLPLMLLGLFLNLGVLFYFKYHDFFFENLNGAFGLHLTLNHLALPLGISFFTFQQLSYVIDSYRRTVPRYNILDYSLFVTFFPQLIAGPIVKYHDVAAQIDSRRCTRDETEAGIRRFIVGLAKKVLISNAAGYVVDKVFSDCLYAAGGLDWRLAWLAGICYTLQIYFDFSGYNDMAIGLGHMFGFTFKENFNFPYASTSMTEFWRRWHISLGAWMRDYVFYPFALTRPVSRMSKALKKKAGTHIARALPAALGNILVFLLVGVWHGAQMNYVLWGLYNGVILAFTALVEPVYKRMNDRLPRLTASGGFHVFRILRTFLVVNIGWYFDRCVRVCDAFAMLHKTFFAFNAQQLFDGTLDTLGLAAKDYRILLVATILLFVVSLMQERGVKIRDFVLSRPLALRWAVLYAFIFFVLATFGGSNVAASGFMYAVF